MYRTRSVAWSCWLVVAWASCPPAGGQQGEPRESLGAAQDEAQHARAALAAGQELTVNEAGLFDVHLRDVPLPEALRLLSMRARRNISVSPGVTANVTSDLYQVSFEESLDALLMPAGYTWFTRDKFVYVCQREEREGLLNANRAVELRVFELDYIMAADVVPVITPLLGPQGTVVSTAAAPLPGVALRAEDYDDAFNSGLGGKSRAVGELVIVRDYPEVLEQIARVIGRLDRRPRQVLVEALILRARLNEQNSLGIDFNTLAGIDFRTIGATSVGGTNLIPGPVPRVAFDSELGAVVTDMSGDIPAGGLNVGIMVNNVALFVRALEEITDVTIVANPKVLAVNEQPGRVIIGREDGYLTTTVTETAAVQEVEFIATGTQILFRPFICGDYVRMDIHPEDSHGGLTPDNLPFKETTEVTSNVMVRDGHTLVIGGLFREVTTASTRQLPWLGNMPVVGALFRGKTDTAIREEVIVLITPHIIDGDELSEESGWAQDEVERRRVLAHRGLMPWGRERLAQAHYRWALEHYRTERVDKALWDLELALLLHPRFVEASRLHDRLTDEQAREPDNSVIRDLLRRLAEEELTGVDDRRRPAAAVEPAGKSERVGTEVGGDPWWLRLAEHAAAERKQPEAGGKR